MLLLHFINFLLRHSLGYLMYVGCLPGQFLLQVVSQLCHLGLQSMIGLLDLDVSAFHIIE
jgi:hypothetical protein